MLNQHKLILAFITFFSLSVSNFACRDESKSIFTFTEIGPDSEENHYSWFATSHDFTHNRLDTLSFNTKPIYLRITIDRFQKGIAKINLISEKGISFYQKEFNTNISFQDTLVSEIPQKASINLSSFSGRIAIVINTN